MQELLTALQTIENPGSFCASGNINPCFLGLEVEKLGPIGLPLIKSQAEAIIGQCKQAPFGRGEQTVVDTAVRRVWELEPAQFSIGNPQWEKSIEDAIQQIKSELGLSDSAVVHEIYKLLLYQAGDFFIPHRDTEKMDNMFATLVVVLPSKHQGGELIINHDGQTRKFDFGGETSAHTISYAAFYADCEHEVKPVTEGYRLCLIYNLALEKTQQQPVAPQNDGVVDNVTQVLKRWEEKDQTDKLVVVLDHHYSQAGLSFQNLKNLDKAQANILVQAAQQANCHAYLGLLTLWEAGELESDGYYYDKSDAEMGEIYDESLSVNYWIDAHGIAQDFGEIDIDQDELVLDAPLDSVEADKEEIEGPTGNAGATIERWYHRAAVIIWRKSQHFSILSQVGQGHAIPQLIALLDSGAPDAIEQSKAFVQEICYNWNPSQYNRFYIAAELNENTNDMLQLLIKLADIDLIKQFMEEILITEFTGLEGNSIANLCQHYGWTTFESLLINMSSQENRDKITQFSQLLFNLCAFQSKDKQAQHRLCLTLANNSLNAVKNQPEDEPRYYWNKENEQKTKKVLIESLFKTLHTLDNRELLNDFTQHLIAYPQKFERYTVLIPVLSSLQTWLIKQNTRCPSYVQLLDDCHLKIQAEATKEIKEPGDWLIKTELSCHCEDCTELEGFMKNPNEQVQRFRMRKDRRQHLEQQIDRQHLDIDCATDRSGSTHTLVCTKNRNSYHQALKQQAVDSELLTQLEEMQRAIAGLSV